MVPPDCLVLFTKINPTNSLQLTMFLFCGCYGKSQPCLFSVNNKYYDFFISLQQILQMSPLHSHFFTLATSSLKLQILVPS